MSLPILCLAVLAALLIRAAWTDLASRTIANRLNLAIALLAVPWWWAIGLQPWPGVAIQLGLAALVFAGFAALFAINMIGGGDVKLLGALALWLPPEELPAMLWAMALCGGLISAGMICHRRLVPAGGGPRPAAEVPYGLAIAIGCIPFITNRILTMGAA
ncbi:MAG: prepilin peptidase [Sphingomonas fennica]